MVVAIALGGAKAHLDHQLHLALDHWKRTTTQPLKMNYTHVGIVPSGAVKVQDIRLMLPNGLPLSIKTATLHQAYRFYDPAVLPEAFQITLTEVMLPIQNATTFPPLLVTAFGYSRYYLSAKELYELGYTAIKANIFIQVNKQQENKMAISALVNAETWGQLTASGHLNAVPPPVKWHALVHQTRLVDLELTYTAGPVIEHLFTYLAQRNTMTAADFKHALVAKATQDMRLVQVETAIIDSLTQFIQAPHQLQASIQPVLPITINQLSHVYLDELGLKITTATPP